MTKDENLDAMQTVWAAPEEPAQDLAPGERFAERYEIEDKLGAGGMGVVWRARDTLVDEVVALKLIHPSLVDTGARERMISEAVLARRVSHPNVVRVFDVGENDGQIFFSMELLNGRPLRAWIAQNLMAPGDAPLEAVLAVVRQLLEGLGAAHRAGLVHRDVKPENIMIEGEPGADNFSLKIVDFGIARGVRASVLTGSRAIGTDLYMAPEQRTSPQAVTAAADVYSVGRVFYEMLMDVLPEGTWNPPSEQRRDVPPALDEVIRRTQLPPARRYRDADELLAAVEAAVASPRAEPEAEPEPRPVAPDARPVPAPADVTEADESWRNTLRKVEDFDRKYNPGHKLREQLGMKERQRFSEMPKGKLIAYAALIGFIVIIVLSVMEGNY